MALLSDEKLHQMIQIMGRTLTRARAEGSPVALCVVDPGGHQVAFLRDPRAKLVTTVTATGKARCAVMFGRDTEHTVAKARNNPTAFQSFVAAADLPFVIGDGGFVVDTPRGLWGVAVAGASKDVDHRLGEALANELRVLLGADDEGRGHGRP